MAFDIKSYRDKHKDYYKNASLREVGEDLYNRSSMKEKYKTPDEWFRKSGVDQDIRDEERETRKQDRVVEDRDKAEGALSTVYRGVRHGLYGVEASYHGIKALGADAFGLDKTRDKAIGEYQDTMSKASRFAHDVSFRDLVEDPSFSESVDWALYTLGDVAPSMASMLATGGAGGLASLAAKKGINKVAGKFVTHAINKQMAKGLGYELAERQVIRGIGMKAGVAMGGAGLEGGGMYGDVAAEISGEAANPMKAAVLGTAAGLVEIVGGNMRLVRKLFGEPGEQGVKAALELAKRSPGLRGQAMSALTTVAREMATQAPQEFAQEAVQEVMSLTHGYWEDVEVAPVLSGDNFWRVLEAGMAGAVAGGAGAVIGGAKDITNTTPDTIRAELAQIEKRIANQEMIRKFPNWEQTYPDLERSYNDNIKVRETLSKRLEQLSAADIQPATAADVLTSDQGAFRVEDKELVESGLKSKVYPQPPAGAAPETFVSLEEVSDILRAKQDKDISESKLRRMIRNKHNPLEGFKDDTGEWIGVTRKSLDQFLEKRGLTSVPMRKELNVSKFGSYIADRHGQEYGEAFRLLMERRRRLGGPTAGPADPWKTGGKFDVVPDTFLDEKNQWPAEAVRDLFGDPYAQELEAFVSFLEANEPQSVVNEFKERIYPQLFDYEAVEGLDELREQTLSEDKVNKIIAKIAGTQEGGELGGVEGREKLRVAESQKLERMAKLRESNKLSLNDIVRRYREVFAKIPDARAEEARLKSVLENSGDSLTEKERVEYARLFAEAKADRSLFESQARELRLMAKNPSLRQEVKSEKFKNLPLIKAKRFDNSSLFGTDVRGATYPKSTATSISYSLVDALAYLGLDFQRDEHNRIARGPNGEIRIIPQVPRLNMMLRRARGGSAAEIAGLVEDGYFGVTVEERENGRKRISPAIAGLPEPLKVYHAYAEKVAQIPKEGQPKFGANEDSDFMPWASYNDPGNFVSKTFSDQRRPVYADQSDMSLELKKIERQALGWGVVKRQKHEQLMWDLRFNRWASLKAQNPVYEAAASMPGTLDKLGHFVNRINVGHGVRLDEAEKVLDQIEAFHTKTLNKEDLSDMKLVFTGEDYTPQVIDRSLAQRYSALYSKALSKKKALREKAQAESRSRAGRLWQIVSGERDISKEAGWVNKVVGRLFKDNGITLDIEPIEVAAESGEIFGMRNRATGDIVEIPGVDGSFMVVEIAKRSRLQSARNRTAQANLFRKFADEWKQKFPDITPDSEIVVLRQTGKGGGLRFLPSGATVKLHLVPRYLKKDFFTKGGEIGGSSVIQRALELSQFREEFKALKESDPEIEAGLNSKVVTVKDEQTGKAYLISYIHKNSNHYEIFELGQSESFSEDELRALESSFKAGTYAGFSQSESIDMAMADVMAVQGGTMDVETMQAMTIESLVGEKFTMSLTPRGESPDANARIEGVSFDEINYDELTDAELVSIFREYKKQGGVQPSETGWARSSPVGYEVSTGLTDPRTVRSTDIASGYVALRNEIRRVAQMMGRPIVEVSELPFRKADEMKIKRGVATAKDEIASVTTVESAWAFIDKVKELNPRVDPADTTELVGKAAPLMRVREALDIFIRLVNAVEKKLTVADATTQVEPVASVNFKGRKVTPVQAMAEIADKVMESEQRRAEDLERSDRGSFVTTLPFVPFGYKWQKGYQGKGQAIVELSGLSRPLLGEERGDLGEGKLVFIGGMYNRDGNYVPKTAYIVTKARYHPAASETKARVSNEKDPQGHVAKSPEKRVYIGRPKAGQRGEVGNHFGNPFSAVAGAVGVVKAKSNNESVQMFEDWILGKDHQNVEPERRKWILENADKLVGKELVCFKHGGRCHGEVLAKLANARAEQRAEVRPASFDPTPDTFFAEDKRMAGERAEGTEYGIQEEAAVDTEERYSYVLERAPMFTDFEVERTQAEGEFPVGNVITMDDLLGLADNEGVSIGSIRRTNHGIVAEVTIDGEKTQFGVIVEADENTGIYDEAVSRARGRETLIRYFRQAPAVAQVPAKAMFAQARPQAVELMKKFRDGLALGEGVKLMLHDHDDAPTVKGRVRAAIYAAEVKGRAFAWYDMKEGVVHVFLNQHLTNDGRLNQLELAKTILHEISGHHGMNMFFPDPADKADFFDKVYKQFSREINPHNLAWSVQDRLHATDEWLARQIQDIEFTPDGKIKNNAVGSYFDLLVTKVRQFLRSIGINLDLSKAEIREIMARSYRGLEMQRTLFGGALHPQLRVGGGVQNYGRGDIFIETTMDKFYRKTVRSLLGVRLMQDSLKKSGVDVTEDADVFEHMKLFPGKVSPVIGMYERREVALGKRMKSVGVKPEDLDLFLQARHAPERNLAIQRREGKDAHCGMTTKQAREIMQSLKAEGLVGWEVKNGEVHYTGKLANIAAEIDKINAEFLELAYDMGEISWQDMVNMQNAYRFHVPFASAEYRTSDSLTPPQRKAGVVKQVRGHEVLSESPSAMTFLRIKRLVLTSEKNSVMQSMFKFAGYHPHRLFKLYRKDGSPELTAEMLGMDEESFARFKKNSGEIAVAENDIVKKAERAAVNNNILPVKFGGHDYYVQVDKPEIFQALTQSGVKTGGKVIRALGGLNRWLTLVHTALNPEFLVSNYFRDVGTAYYNLQMRHGLGNKEEAKAFAKRVSWRSKNAMAGILLYNFGEGHVAKMLGRKFKMEEVKVYRDMYEHFVKAGGKVGMPFLGNVEVQMNEIKGRLKTAAEGHDGALATALGGGKWLRDLIFDANEAVENGVRLAAFAEAVNSGISEQKAAILARDMTVDFNEKGELGTIINSLYLFANAGIQGTLNIFRHMRNDPKYAGLLVGKMVAASFALAIFNRFAGGDDEDDKPFYEKISPEIRATNLVVMIPGGAGAHIKIPLPYGFGFFFNMGQTMASVVWGETDTLEASGQIIENALHNFNPIGGGGGLKSAHDIVRTVTPTIGAPFVDIAYERNVFGSKLMPEPRYPGQPDSERYWNSVHPTARIAAEQLNKLTGGSGIKPGITDISPETIEHLFGEFTGGAGRFWLDRLPNLIVNASQGKDIEFNDIPIARRLVGEPFGFANRTVFEENYQEIKSVYEMQRELAKRVRDARDPQLKNAARVQLQEFTKEHMPVLRLYQQSKKFYRILMDLKDRKSRVYRSGLPKEKTEEAIKLINEATDKLYLQFNKAAHGVL